MTAAVAATLASLAAALAAHFLGRGLVTQAARLGLEDIPNHRSSHVRVTPRGGGLAILAGLLLAVGLLAASGTAIDPGPGWRLAMLAALGLAVVGLIDDLRTLGQGLRLLAQALAVGLVLAAAALQAQADPSPASPPAMASLSVLSPLMASGLLALALMAGLWWVNLFNFMDGIDGLATTEALFLVLAYLLVRLVQPDAKPSAIDGYALLLAAALLGYLPLNWPPARIFLGDVGSLFLGVSIFLLATHSVTSGRISPWFWLLAAGSFICDASATLLRRLISGQDVFSAHRSHLYQRLSRRWSGHLRVTLVYSAINISWFLPLALLAQIYPRFGGALMFAGYAPALMICWFAGAGTPDNAPPATSGDDAVDASVSGVAASDRDQGRTQRS